MTTKSPTSPLSRRCATCGGPTGAVSRRRATDLAFGPCRLCSIEAPHLANLPWRKGAGSFFDRMAADDDFEAYQAASELWRDDVEGANSPDPTAAATSDWLPRVWVNEYAGLNTDEAGRREAERQLAAGTPEGEGPVIWFRYTSTLEPAREIAPNLVRQLHLDHGDS